MMTLDEFMAIYRHACIDIRGLKDRLLSGESVLYREDKGNTVCSAKKRKGKNDCVYKFDSLSCVDSRILKELNARVLLSDMGIHYLDLEFKSEFFSISENFICLETSFAEYSSICYEDIFKLSYDLEEGKYLCRVILKATPSYNAFGYHGCKIMMTGGEIDVALNSLKDGLNKNYHRGVDIVYWQVKKSKPCMRNTSYNVMEFLDTDKNTCLYIS